MDKKMVKNIVVTMLILIAIILVGYTFNTDVYAYTPAKVEEGFYNIYSCVGNDKVIDIDNASETNGANAQIYAYNATWAQNFKIIQDKNGYYEIINRNSGKLLDIKDGKIYNGANVWQYEKNNTDAQKWMIEENADGTYTISSKLNSKYCLDINQGENKSGANLQVYEKNEAFAQKFKLVKSPIKESKKTIENGTYKILSLLDETKVIDVKDGLTTQGANIQLYVDNNTDAQKFEIQYGEDGYYTIINKKSGKAMSTQDNNIKSGGNVFQGNQVSTDAQKWIIQKNSDNTYSIFSKQSELCLDIADAKNANGTNIWEYKYNGTNAQKFRLLPIETVSKEQVLDDGIYNIRTSLNTEKVIDIQNESKNREAIAQINDINNAISQRFEFKYNSDGCYTIKNKNSNKVLDIRNGNPEAGTYVWQYDENGTSAQRWILKDIGNGYYHIISKLNGLYLTVENSSTGNGTKLKMLNKNDKANQKFKLSEYIYATPEKNSIEDGIYQIVLKNNLVVDVENTTYANYGNIHIWENKREQQQKFMIKQINDTGYYEIINMNSGKALDVYNGDQKISTNVDQYERNNTDAQKWIIKNCGDGYYTIISKCNNLALDVQGGLSNRNGTNIQVYFNNGTDAQKFKLQKIEAIKADTYEIETALNANKVLDIAWGATNDGANVQLYTADNVDQQKFIFEYNNGEYIIKAKHSGKVLTVDTNNNNVYQSTYKQLDNQKWIIEPAGNGYYHIISKYNGLYLDVDNASSNNGTNIKVYQQNNSTNAQKFKFFKGFRTFFEEGTYGSSGFKVAGDWRGTDLKYYKFGKGNNVLFATFSIHGFEDSYYKDGSELTYIAEQFKSHLQNTTDGNIISNWTIYILPDLNPDGQIYGWTNNGPGRTTFYSAAPGNQGIDMNRNWQMGSSYARYYDTRNYNGTAAYQAYEVRALRDFLLSHKSVTGQTILVDLHGWLNETIGDDGLGRYYRNYYGMSTHISSYGNGYLVNWARQQLGNGNRTARSVLVELPQVYSHQNILDWNYAGKYINATLNMLRENG